MTLWESLLWPLSVPYGAVTHLRARAYRKGILKQRHLDGAVISVGNLTVGGTGKTPMVLWIAECLVGEGKRVGILTRGYRGTAARSETGGKPGSSEVTSDEVQMLKDRLGEAVEFGVGPDRFEEGKKLAARGVKWFILDDGFQHLALARNVDVVVIDATNPFGGGHLLPAGRLRESRTSLVRADIIVITRSHHAPAIEAAIRRDSDAPIFYARTELDSVRGVWTERLGDEEARHRKLFAFCGIGNPSSFVADLRDWGFQIAGHKFFPDHYRYSQRDADELESAASAAGAASLVCTEKDLFNLSGVRWRKCDLFVCRISMRVEREDEFWRAILTKAESRAAAAR